jgi:RNA recognition motif-containing protein
MNRRLFVGSLPYDTTKEQLEEIFMAVGRVVGSKVIMDKFTGQSKGFGFVEMATEDDARNAIERLNGSTVGRRQIIVNEARPRVGLPGSEVAYANARKSDD